MGEAADEVLVAKLEDVVADRDEVVLGAGTVVLFEGPDTEAVLEADCVARPERVDELADAVEETADERSLAPNTPPFLDATPSEFFR